MLYDRIINNGTIEEPSGKPQPQWALKSTVHWMRALRMLIEDQQINFQNALSFYQNNNASERRMSCQEENTVLEQLLLALHHLSALDNLNGTGTASDYARVGVLAWYYGITNAASAMFAAQAGTFQSNHAGTAREWDVQIVGHNLAMPPFSWRVSSLLECTFEKEIKNLKRPSEGTLKQRPNTVDEAHNAAAEYLAGSARYYKWLTENDLKNTKEFKKLCVDNFRTKPARELRDDRLAKKSVGFLHQASRYRGKANYREALYLAYGTSTNTTLADYQADMHRVLEAFLAMAGAFASRKLNKDLWSAFIIDIDKKKAFTAPASKIWNA